MPKKLTDITEIVRRSRLRSRQLHGRPGQGRKTRHLDRRKEAIRLACRGKNDVKDLA